MKLYCPHCGVKGVADDSYRGRKVKCPKCRGAFVAEGDAAADVEGWEQPAGVVTEEPSTAESETNLQKEEPGKELPGRSGEEGRDAVSPGETGADEVIPAEEAPTVEEVSAEEAGSAEAEAGQESAARETVEDLDEEAIEAIEGEEAVVASGMALEQEKEPAVEEQETVLESDELLAEIQVKGAAEGEERDKGIPGGRSTEMAGGDSQPTEEKTVGAEIAEPAAESPDAAGRQVEKEEIAAAEQVELREEAAVESARKEESLDDHFIFEDRKPEPEPAQEVEEDQPGLIREQCRQCGKKNRSGVPFADRSGRLYCPDCLPFAEQESAPEPPAFGEPTAGASLQEQDDASSGSEETARFTISRALREAWEKTKGAKGSIWAGSAVMYLTVIILAAGGTLLLPGFGQETATDPVAEIANFALQTLIDILSVLFTAGLLFMGIRKAAGDFINWKMVFTGFSDAGKIIVATLLQSLMIFLGFLVLVLPGIYLAVGYSMTLPLIVDRKMSPWQAMETSRKAVHEVWWRVVGLYLAMVLLLIVSLVPFGLGLIWTWPMFIILAGVVYRHLFRFEK